MTIPQLSERSVRIAVLGFSLIGLIILSVIASLTEYDTIHIRETEEHIGERVKLSGMVVGTSPSSSDTAWLMLMEDNDTMEVYIERGKGDIPPGSKVTCEGEIITIDGEPVLSVQNEEHLDIRKGESQRSIEDGILPGAIHHFIGVVRSSRYIGWNEQELVLTSVPSDNEGATFIIRLVRYSERLRSGDTVNISALFTDKKSGLTFGERSLVILSRAEPRTITLLRLVEELRNDPGIGSSDPVTIDGYMRYPSSGRSLYISDQIEGGDISIKVTLQEPLEGGEKGDLVRLYNCSLIWEAEDMRFELQPESGMIMERYGPWKLNLEMLENGLMEFEGSLVEIEGTMVEDGPVLRLVDGDRSVEIKCWNGSIDEAEQRVVGRVLFDEVKNTLYIEAEVDHA
jgi:hypothetical protein